MPSILSAPFRWIKWHFNSKQNTHTKFAVFFFFFLFTPMIRLWYKSKTNEILLLCLFLFTFDLTLSSINTQNHTMNKVLRNRFKFIFSSSRLNIFTFARTSILTWFVRFVLIIWIFWLFITLNLRFLCCRYDYFFFIGVRVKIFKF